MDMKSSVLEIQGEPGFYFLLVAFKNDGKYHLFYIDGNKNEVKFIFDNYGFDELYYEGFDEIELNDRINNLLMTYTYYNNIDLSKTIYIENEMSIRLRTKKRIRDENVSLYPNKKRDGKKRKRKSRRKSRRKSTRKRKLL